MNHLKSALQQLWWKLMICSLAEIYRRTYGEGFVL